jgi:hypothetical protein
MAIVINRAGVGEAVCAGARQQFTANAVGACSQAGAGVYTCFPDWVRADPREQYEFAKCVVDGSSWYEYFDSRVQACALWLASFDVTVLTQGIEEGWDGTAAERERIRSNLLKSVSTSRAKAEEALAWARENGDTDLESAALEELAHLDNLEQIAREELPADFFYFQGVDAGETAADAVDAVKKLGRQATDLVLKGTSKLVWWITGTLVAVAAVGGIAYGVASKKRTRKKAGE